MSDTVKHAFVSGKVDDPDTTLVRPSNWNHEHIFNGGTAGYFLQRDTGATDGASWGLVPKTWTNINEFGTSEANIQTALDSGLALFFPNGLYTGNWTISNGATCIYGAGFLTIFKPLNIAEPVFTVTAAAIPNTPGRLFQDFVMSGDFGPPRTATGVQYDVLFNNDVWNRIFFFEFDHAFNATTSAIGAMVSNCHFQNINYGLYFKATSPHSLNLNRFTLNRFILVDKVCIYLNGTLGGGNNNGSGNYFYDNWFEANAGICIFVKDFGLEGRSVNVVEKGWFENNASAVTVDLDDEGVITPYAIHMTNGGKWYFGPGVGPESSLFSDNMQVYFEDFKIASDADIPVISDDVLITMGSAFTDRGGGIAICSPVTGGRILVDKIRNLRDVRPLVAETFARVDITTGETNMLATTPKSVPDVTASSGGASSTIKTELYNGFAIRTIDLPDENAFQSKAAQSITSGMWYLHSFAVRSNGASGNFRITAPGGTISLLSGLITLTAHANRWTTYLFISSPLTTGTTGFRFQGHADGPINIDVSMLQMWEFETSAAAYHAADARQFLAVSPDLETDLISAAMPTTGAFFRGTFVHNSNPLVDVNNMILTGWMRLTTSGAHVPGTDWALCYASTVTPAT